MTTFNAYHFTNKTLRDGRPVPAIGETLVHTGPIVWCRSGLYASRTAWSALCHAPGPMLHRVLCEDIEREDDDKLVCRRRTIVATIDANRLMRRFAADQALSVADLWGMPDVVRDYLTTLDETKLAAAWTATRTEWAVTRTARDAARDVAWIAARAATRDAAWTAAWIAAWTARDAAWTADLTKAAADFNARVDAAFSA